MASFKGWPSIVTRANIPGRRTPSALLKRAFTVIVPVLSDTSWSNWYDVDVSSYFLPLLKVRDAVGGVGSSGSLSLAMRKFKNSFSLIEN